MGQLQRYTENPTVVTLERDFRTWSYNLPAVTACNQYRVNNESLETAIRTLWKVNSSEPRYQYYARFVETVANSDLYHLSGYQRYHDDETLHVDLHQLVLQVQPDLAVMKTELSEPVAPAWDAVMTEAGLCHTINSVALSDVAVRSPPTNLTAPHTCSYSAQGCYMVFESTKLVDYYVHSPYDVADMLSPASRSFPALIRFTVLSAVETRAGRGVRELPARSRRCLYIDEPAHADKRVYSTNTCKLSCRSRLSVQLCGCKPFYYHYEGFTASEPMCTPSGMWCLAAHSHQLATFVGVKCSCNQQCLDSTYREVSNEDQTLTRGPFLKRGAIRFTIQPPRTRFTREIVFHFQDLVVSFGGAASLFLGASFISFVEIVYLFLERIFSAESSKGNNKNSITSRPYEHRLRQLNKTLSEDLYWNGSQHDP